MWEGAGERKRGGAEPLKKERNQSSRRQSGEAEAGEESSRCCEHPQQGWDRVPGDTLTQGSALPAHGVWILL